MASITNHRPAFFEIRKPSPNDPIPGAMGYKLNLQKLDSNKCHLIFEIQLHEVYLTITALEHFVFPPSNPALNRQFHLKEIQCGQIKMWWCSFPIAFKQQCIRIAEIFKLALMDKSRHMIAKTSEFTKVTDIQLPPAPNVLNFTGPRSQDAKEFKILHQQILRDAVQFAKIDLD